MSLRLEILRAIATLQPVAYGVSIRDEIMARTGKEWPFGSIYAAIEQLEDSALISSREGEAVAGRGRRKKMYFDLTAVGRREIEGTDNA